MKIEDVSLEKYSSSFHRMDYPVDDINYIVPQGLLHTCDDFQQNLAHQRKHICLSEKNLLLAKVTTLNTNTASSESAA